MLSQVLRLVEPVKVSMKVFPQASYNNRRRPLNFTLDSTSRAGLGDEFGAWGNIER